MRKSDKQTLQTMIVCILRKLKTMNMEELRRMYDMGCEICEKKRN